MRVCSFLPVRLIDDGFRISQAAVNVKEPLNLYMYGLAGGYTLTRCSNTNPKPTVDKIDLIFN
jgi:hypothetical protein